MSKKYEHRIESLKEHKEEKGKGHYRHKKNSRSGKRNLKSQRKAYNDFHKKLEKSKKIW
ncbi:MAG: hypothetical protein ACTSQP_02980 [Promethearchaeota archaeon]